MVLPNGGGVYVGTAANAVSAFTSVHVEHVQLVAHEEVASGETRRVPEHTPRISINGSTVRTLQKKLPPNATAQKISRLFLPRLGVSFIYYVPKIVVLACDKLKG